MMWSHLSRVMTPMICGHTCHSQLSHVVTCVQNYHSGHMWSHNVKIFTCPKLEKKSALIDLTAAPKVKIEMESPAELHFRSYLIDSATISSHSTHVRFRHFVPLPTSPPKEILCVRPSIHNILGLSPSALPNPLPLPVLGRRCRRCRSGIPLRHISGGRKTPVSAFKISLRGHVQMTSA